MFPYLVLFSTVSLLAIANHIKEIRQNRLVLYIFCVLFLILFGGLRQLGVGADDFNYSREFVNVHEYLSFADGKFAYSIIELNMEYGFVLLMSLLRYLTDEYTVFFLVVAVLTTGINAWNYYRISRYAFLVLLLYVSHTFLHKDINALRSGIASAILLFTVVQVYNRQHLRFLLTVILACLFHVSAIVVLIPYFLSFIRIRRAHFGIALAASIAIGSVGVGHLVLNNLPNLGVFTQKLSYYLEWEVHNRRLGLLDVVNVKNILLMCLFLLYYDKLKCRFMYFEVVFLFFASATILRLTFNDFALFAGRAASMVGITEVLLIPSILYCTKQRIIATMMIILYASLIFLLNLKVAAWGSGVYQTSLF